MSSILRYLTSEDEARLLASATRQAYAAQDVILREGERPRCLFILRRGAARVERSHGEYNVEISRLGRGELFGEMGFVEDFPASASVVADEACEVQSIDEGHVHEIVGADPAFAGRFYRSIAELLSRRLRATSVEALSEFSWGTGGFHRQEGDAGQEASAGSPRVAASWGGGSPLREEPD